ncbi:ankyrin repeat-containing protein BDA1-like isoform X2 [Trifolium pratense]|uniref:ankyrin repeat-containing protein BDA1-like isoform X2 n=1 Tax=Trifolium pratense TaxID=57577 RepID=UPI001E69387E|nr:ankyrin repeat-containing protein BDA1-like isoform X2 [Trifolium pratense]
MNLTNIIYKLKLADEEENINLLYEVIQDNPSILEIIDSKQFVETPLHIAASRGQIQFANEIMNLKPSFASKLNPQGFSPIHLAMQENKNRMVLCFVNMNKDLVRVKGKGGLTPLHFASRNKGDVELLANFLSACPNSIEDLTVKGETALHIAVKNNNYEALELLICCLRRNITRGARELHYNVINLKDEADNTVLHILAQRNLEPQTLGLLLKTKINLNAKNLENNTALDMALNEDIRRKLLSVGVKPGLRVRAAPTLAQRLKSNITIIDKVVIYIKSLRRDISEKQRNTWLIVATLVATSVYQSALNPPGGVYQVNANSGNGGKSVMPNSYFLPFSLVSMFAFLVSILAILLMTPSGLVLGGLVIGPVGWFSYSYLISMLYISPHSNIIFVIIIYVVGCVLSTVLVIPLYYV